MGVEAVDVLIGPPADHDGGDEEWLEQTVVAHGGNLSDLVLSILPGGRHARFADRTVAESFVEELRATRRWRARMAN